MSVRYSLAGISYFDKNTRGNKAVRDSLALTKGAWLTTMASQSIMHFVTLGMAGDLFAPGARAVLYRQLDTVTTAGQIKPKAHLLSWLTLLLPILLVFIFVAIIGLIIAAAVNYVMLNPGQ